MTYNLKKLSIYAKYLLYVIELAYLTKLTHRNIIISKFLNLTLKLTSLNKRF